MSLPVNTELRRFARHPMARAALVVAVLVPLLYGALYLAAFWNPTGHLDQLPVAVVDEDHPVTSDGRTISAGADLTRELLESDSVQWHQVDAATARTGLDDGTYYAILTIPSDFSAGIETLGTDQPRVSALQVTYDDTHGYTARTILTSVMKEVRAKATASVGDGVVDQLLIGVGDLRDGIGDAADGAGKIDRGTARAATSSGQLADGLGDLAEGAGKLSTAADQASTGADTLAGGAHRLTTGTGQLRTGSADLATGTGALATGAKKAHQGASALATGSQQTATGASTLSSGLDELDTGAAQLPAATRQLADGSRKVADGNREVADTVGSAADKADAAGDALEVIIEELPEDDPNRAKALAELEKVRNQVDTARTSTEELAQGAEKVAKGNAALAQQAPALASGVHSAAEGAQQLKTGTSKVAAGASTLSTGTAQLSTGAADAAAGARRLSSGATQVDTGARQLDSGATTLATGLRELDRGAGSLATASGRAAAGAGELRSGLLTLGDATGKLSSGLDDALDQTPDYTEAERTANAAAMSDPVGLEAGWTHEAATNGEGFAPYFTGLALYVGALVLWMLLRPISRRALSAPVGAFRVVLRNFAPAALLGLAQAVVLTAVIVVGLGLHPHRLGLTLLIAILASAAFVALQQLLNIAFGPAGRVLVLVLLMLQLTSAGGTYPVSTTPRFFQVLHPWLPLTHVVDGMRAAITGDGGQTVWLALGYLAVVLIGSLLLSTLVARRQRTWTLVRLHPAVSL